MFQEKPELVKEPYMLTIKPDGAQMYLSLTSTNIVELLHTAVEDYFELVPYFNTLGDRPCLAFCGENAKMKGLKHNALAHELWERANYAIASQDYLVGPIAIIVAPQEFLARL